ncbi:MAG TPA: ferredoxin [Peptococcaceae bacterium]|nr:ferredoxin [Clostridia bacterium]HOB82231.1 ferredoxin [Peptococcaceae bacterium]HPZ71513.1 ferredoxin [Peptococcaceae bacterium]HQD54132.1 ferredoxin [Peptococcaceae bacterium]
MKVRVDPELCIACGACVSLVPEVYDWDDDGKAVAVEDEVPVEMEDEVKESIEDCPTDAIAEV